MFLSCPVIRVDNSSSRALDLGQEGLDIYQVRTYPSPGAVAFETAHPRSIATIERQLVTTESGGGASWDNI